MNEVAPADDSLPKDFPLHGFRGERTTAPAARMPLAAAVAVSREVGARGVLGEGRGAGDA